MNHVIGVIREFNTAQFRVVIDALEEDSPDLSWDDTGEVREKINSGEYLVFQVRARVIHDAMGEIATDYLGNCIHASLADFMDHRQCGAQTRRLRAEGSTAVCGSYFADMVKSVCADARKAIRRAQQIKVRK